MSERLTYIGSDGQHADKWADDYSHRRKCDICQRVIRRMAERQAT